MFEAKNFKADCQAAVRDFSVCFSFQAIYTRDYFVLWHIKYWQLYSIITSFQWCKKGDFFYSVSCCAVSVIFSHHWPAVYTCQQLKNQSLIMWAACDRITLNVDIEWANYRVAWHQGWACDSVHVMSMINDKNASSSVQWGLFFCTDDNVCFDTDLNNNNSYRMHELRLCYWAASECDLINKGIALLRLMKSSIWLHHSWLNTEQCLSISMNQKRTHSQCCWKLRIWDDQQRRGVSERDYFETSSDWDKDVILYHMSTLRQCSLRAHTAR